jgi:hypothetical protein
VGSDGCVVPLSLFPLGAPVCGAYIRNEVGGEEGGGGGGASRAVLGCDGEGHVQEFKIVDAERRVGEERSLGTRVVISSVLWCSEMIWGFGRGGSENMRVRAVLGRLVLAR